MGLAAQIHLYMDFFPKKCSPPSFPWVWHLQILPATDPKQYFPIPDSGFSNVDGKYRGVKSYMQIFDFQEAQCPNP